MKKVLIIEDEYRSREGLRRLIETLHMDYHVVGEAEDGVEGLQMIGTLDPDVVFVDIQMPRMSGLELIGHFRELRRNKDCYFIILSGHADFAYAQEAVRQGAFRYLLKPTTVGDIKDVLEALEAKVEEDSRRNVVEEPSYSDAVQYVVNRIQGGYADALRLESIADELHLSVPYLSSLFSEETGSTFSEYLKKVRMEQAIAMLQEQNMKIYEISCAVGYPDQKYFSKVFKEYTGVSPKAYSRKGQTERGTNEEDV